MTRINFQIASTLAILLWLASPAHAWNRAGHMTSGVIAYQVLLKESPQTIKKVVAILKDHPFYKKTWEPRLREKRAEDRDLYLFTMAARWPDDVRDEAKFHHFNWHFINMPYKPAGEPAGIRTREPESNNILRAYQHNLEILKKKSSTPQERAMALAWILHLVADVHQPLHAATLFSRQFPKGDRGGNSFFIRVEPGTSPISLHQFWDDLIQGSQNFQSVKNRGTELRLRPEFAKGKLKELAEPSFDKWAAESFQLAQDAVYRNGKLRGSHNRNDAPVLPADYPETVQPIAERRLALAGYRMAQILGKNLD